MKQIEWDWDPGVVKFSIARSSFPAANNRLHPKAGDCLIKGIDTLLTFMGYPTAHWLHLRTTNAIESTVATVKARTRTTKGACSHNAGLAMAFKLLTQDERCWCRVNSPRLVALVAAVVKLTGW
jgi:hypothetical protein